MLGTKQALYYLLVTLSCWSWVKAPNLGNIFRFCSNRRLQRNRMHQVQNFLINLEIILYNYNRNSFSQVKVGTPLKRFIPSCRTAEFFQF